MSQKKSVIFKHLLPVIKQYQQVGFTHEKIVALLRDEHDLDLVTTETFKSYLYRYAKVTSTLSENIKMPNTLQTPREIKKSSKLEHVCYDIRGPVLRAANEMEEAGHKIIKLNIGNPAPFGFDTQNNVNPGAVVISNEVTLQEYDDAPVQLGNAGAAYSINGGPWQTGVGKIVCNGPSRTACSARIRIRHKANSSSLGYTKSYVQVGGVRGNFTTRTKK